MLQGCAPRFVCGSKEYTPEETALAKESEGKVADERARGDGWVAGSRTGRVAAVVDLNEIIVLFSLKLTEGEDAVERKRVGRIEFNDERARHVVQVFRGRH